MRVLFLENHDSFSRNVIDRLPVRPGEVVVRDGGEAGRDPRALDGFDAVVLGPGPTDPVRAGLVGLVCEADRRAFRCWGSAWVSRPSAWPTGRRWSGRTRRMACAAPPDSNLRGCSRASTAPKP